MPTINEALTLPALTTEEKVRAHLLLAARVASMMGRKFEEGDWTTVYSEAKAIPPCGWSNLNIDIMHDGLGVEQKMLCVTSHKTIKENCGLTLMHPSATRSIRIPETKDANKAAKEVLRQYAQLIAVRTEKVRETSRSAHPDMRTGWLLWQETLEEFLYFEVQMIAPNPEDYSAEWHARKGGGSRKESNNIWVYEKSSGKKKFSITTSAGAKIQPYFDVPPPSDPNLYYFRVQGEEIKAGLIRIWITKPTALFFKTILKNDLSTKAVSSTILGICDLAVTEAKAAGSESECKLVMPTMEAAELTISREAYDKLVSSFPGVSDEHRIQLLIAYMAGRPEREII
jgi:hypothetical protein